MKLFKYLVGGALLVDQSNARVRRGKLRRTSTRSLPKHNDFVDRFELPQGDDPYASFADDRGPRPDVPGTEPPCDQDGKNYSGAKSSGNTSSQNNDEICEQEPAPYCPPKDECTAEIIKEKDCTCKCDEEPAPNCDLDVVLLIDVCSCSIDVWNGIKSYADALVGKYQQEIGISAEETRVSLIQFSQFTKTVVSFGDDYKKLEQAVKDMKMDDFVAQGMYVTNGIDNAIEDFKKNGRETATKVLITVTDGYAHPNIKAVDVERKLAQLGSDVQLHAISRLEFRRKDECDFDSMARKNVCEKRADIMTLLNGGDDNIYKYSDAQSTHDVIESGKQTCVPPATKSIHCDCECPLPVGCPGEVGPNGDEGGHGKKGPVGDVGDDGENGHDGPDGEDGEKGPKGPNGSNGFNGPPGEPGTDGRPGEHGERGNQGKLGEKGIKGPQGPSGDTGDNGSRGTEGLAGKNGIDGMPGAPGPAGPKKYVDMSTLKDAVFAILDELKPGGESATDKLAKMNLFNNN